jgi:hypothetical protein
MDVVPITGLTVAVVRSPWSARNALIAALGVAAIVGVGILWSRRRRPGAIDASIPLPDRITPLSVIAALRRIESERASQLGNDERARLAAEIGALERTYFGPAPAASQTELKPSGNGGDGERQADAGSLRTVLERWARRAAT